VLIVSDETLTSSRPARSIWNSGPNPLEPRSPSRSRVPQNAGSASRPMAGPPRRMTDRLAGLGAGDSNSRAPERSSRCGVAGPAQQADRFPPSPT